MALETSGYISLGGNVAGRSVAKELNDGAPNFTSTISLNDGNVRSLAQRTGSVSISMSHLRGKSASVDTQTVTVGVFSMTLYGNTSNTRGYHGDLNVGSISDGTCNFKSGATIGYLAYYDQNGTTNKQVQFRLNGNHSNSGFTTMSVAGTNYARTSATYVYSGGNSHWTWSSSTNPFGTTSGATKVVTFS